MDNFKKNSKKTQIWFMRQAGRYLKEYNETKSLVNSFLELCYNPVLASKVTLQPIKRFDFDAAIIFSDILVILDAIGFDVNFLPCFGPVVKNNFQKFFEIDLKNMDCQKLNYVYEAIRLTRENLDAKKSLIGFCGAPWTLAAYVLEGGPSKDFHIAKKFIYENKEEFDFLIKTLQNAILSHFEGQILAGCNIVQLFDSHSGVLDELDYEDFVLKPTFEIFSVLKKKYPQVKIIWFPRNSSSHYLGCKNHPIFELIDGLSIDYSTSIDLILENIDKRIFIQGNLDPSVLECSNKLEIKRKIEFILKKFSNRNHVFNLGHGILKTTPVENVHYAICLVRNFVLKEVNHDESIFFKDFF